MSRSIKHEKTTGFLEHAGKIRKARKAARWLKAELLNNNEDQELDINFMQYAES